MGYPVHRYLINTVNPICALPFPWTARLTHNSLVTGLTGSAFTVQPLRVRRRENDRTAELTGGFVIICRVVTFIDPDSTRVQSFINYLFTPHVRTHGVHRYVGKYIHTYNVIQEPHSRTSGGSGGWSVVQQNTENRAQRYSGAHCTSGRSSHRHPHQSHHCIPGMSQ